MSAISGKIAAGAATLYRVLKTIAVWGLVALAGYLLFPIVSTYISGLQLATIIVAINAMATITLWREAARKPPRPRKEYLKKLMDSEPIAPKHNPPQVAGGAFSSQALDDRRFFADFAAFADVVNWWLADEHVGSRWRLQELPDGDVRLNVDFSYGPTLGRCYDIFHNQVRLGRLEIRPDYKYSTATPKVITEIELDSVRLLSFDNIAEFLGVIAMHVCDKKVESDDHFDANQAIVGALTKVLWQNQQITEFADLDGQDWGELSLHLQGQASAWYFSRGDALDEQQAERTIRRDHVRRA